MHQGNPVLLPAAGRQCVANVLNYILYTNVKVPSTYVTDDVDAILYQGSSLYNQIVAHRLMTNDFLLTNEFPSEVYIDRSLYQISYGTVQMMHYLV